MPLCMPAHQNLCHLSCLFVFCLQGRGAATGYDYAVALPASGDSEELAKENAKSAASLKGEPSRVFFSGWGSQH